MSRGAILILLLLLTRVVFAQDKYWVSFTDKKGVCLDIENFSERTICQREKFHIPFDSADYPVNEQYLTTVNNLSTSISWPSRWLNGVAIYAKPSQMEDIMRLPFVKSVAPMRSQSMVCSNDNLMDQLKRADSLLLGFQTYRMQGAEFKRKQLDGKGIRIAVFDAGFPGVDVHPAFSHLIKNGRIVETYDFVAKKKNVFKHNAHGAATLSCIGGKFGEKNMGLAPGAEYLLARTERGGSETFSEEENWLAAAEWADRNGVNIISSSLGYTYHRYFPTDMNGVESLVSRAANMAAAKGILVVSSAGNEGQKDWRIICTPADADSVMCVGGTDPYTDLHITFSSYGPSSDGRLKPNVSAVGEVVAAGKRGYGRINGTSFSAPLVAGFAACAWQAHPEWSCMELFHAIEKSGHLYPYFDYAHGYGIPQAKNITEDSIPKEATFDFLIINNEIKVALREAYSYPNTEEALGVPSRRNFFYKIEGRDGRIKGYYVLLGDRKEMLHVFAEDFDAGDVLTVHFEGYTSSLDFPEVEN